MSKAIVKSCLRYLVAAALAASPTFLMAQEVCAIPAEVERPVALTPDYVNADKPTDYLALVLSWSPEHCEDQRNKPPAVRKKHAFQCFTGNRFEWVVHGLWPQNGAAKTSREHPRHCKVPDALPTEFVRQHLCMMPGGDLMQNEWQAHGTCGWPAAPDYLADIHRVYDALGRPTTVQMLGDGHGTNRLVNSTPANVKTAFLNLNAGLRAEHLRINVAGGNRLKEMWICLDKNLKPMACPAGGTPDQQKITVRTPYN